MILTLDHRDSFAKMFPEGDLDAMKRAKTLVYEVLLAARRAGRLRSPRSMRALSWVG
jgi:hypothetical protein